MKVSRELHHGRREAGSSRTTQTLQCKRAEEKRGTLENLLIIGNDRMNADAVLSMAAGMGIRGKYIGSLREGIEHLTQDDFSLVIVEPSLPDGDGLSLLSKAAKTNSRPETIIMTSTGNPEEAERAIKSGAWDYVKTPISPEDLKRLLTHALAYYQREKQQRKDAVDGHLNRRGIIGESAPLRTCLEQVADAAATDVDVLIEGETGTGKELFAAAIHRNSARRDQGLVVVDCASLPKTLVESTLFGYEKGAFTGADRARDGLVKQADQGTLFLDEVGELPLDIQKKFLRMLQERTFRPVGSKQVQRSHFRLVAATNRDLVQMAANGSFRKDLLFRLKAMSITLPPLRERKEDLKHLVQYHMRQACKQYHLPMKQLSDDFIDALAAYHWPGNVRELNQAVESALVSAGRNEVVFPQDLPMEVRAAVARKSVVNEAETDAPEVEGIWNEIQLPNPLPPVKELRDRAMDELLSDDTRELIRRTAGNAEEARRIAGLSRSRIYALLKRYGPMQSPQDDDLAQNFI